MVECYEICVRLVNEFTAVSSVFLEELLLAGRSLDTAEIQPKEHAISALGAKSCYQLHLKGTGFREQTRSLRSSY